MDNREEILTNRNRIRGQLIGLNITKLPETESSPNKISYNPNSKINTQDFFDRVLSQKCETQSSFQQLFETQDKLGEGAQSVVRRVTERKTGKQFASKTIGNADAEKIMGVKKQYKLLKVLDFPSVIQAHYLFISQHESICRLVLELYDSPTLKEAIDQFKFNEETTSEIAKTLLQTADYLHSHGVCHRDIKPQNILYSLQEGALKLIDFEVSALERPDHTQMWTVTGTLYYKAPEMFSGSYNNKVDIWAIGIVVFELLHGYPPFTKEYVEDTIEEIRSTPITAVIREDLDAFTIDFLQKCLAKDPNARLTAKQALKQPFILQAANKSITPKDDNKLNNSFDEPKFEVHTSWGSQNETNHFIKKASLQVKLPVQSHSVIFDAEFGIRLQAKKLNNLD